MQTITSLVFHNDANVLFAGTFSGVLLQWDMSRYWSASYWTQSSESSTDARLPSLRVPVMNGAISRLLLLQNCLFVAGREGLLQLRFPDLNVQGRVVLGTGQRSFNALCFDVSMNAVLCGAEDGSVVSVNADTMENESFLEPSESQAAVLDIAAGASTVFVACAKGFVSAIDRETRAAVWRINMRTASTSLDDSVATNLRATVVRLDPSGKWLLCGAGSGAASGEGGFLSIWHSETREVVSVMLTRGCPSGATWYRGAIVSCGGENVVHQFDFNGKLLASSGIELSEALDVACYHHPDDLVGGAIAVGGAGTNHVLIIPAIGRKAWTLQIDETN